MGTLIVPSDQILSDPKYANFFIIFLDKPSVAILQFFRPADEYLFHRYLLHK